MLLNSIQTLSSFPYENIGIFINETISPEISSRMGVRFRNNEYYDNVNILNRNPSLTLKQGGLEPDLLFSPLASYYNITQIKQFSQPTNFVNLPNDFPIFFATSAIPNHDILLNFRGGLSAISIFPSKVYPLIKKLSSDTIQISGSILPLSAFNGNIDIKNYYSSIDRTKVLPLTTASLSAPNVFDSNHKNNFLWKQVTTNPLVNNIFINELLPATRPYDTNIIPQSFSIVIPISSNTQPFPFNYPLSYSNTDNSKYYLSGMNVEILPKNPIFTNAYITSNLDNTFGLSMTLDSNYIVPKNAEIYVNYETKNAPATVVTTNVGTNSYTVSSSVPPYLHFYQSALTFGSNTISDASTIYYTPSASITHQGTSAVSLSTVMVDNFFQTSFPINLDQSKMQLKFIESSGDITLSAIDPITNKKYLTNTWMPASANLLFINDGKANYHSLTYQLSSYNNSIYNYGPTNFILNKDKAKLTLFLTEFSENSARAIGSLYPLYDTTLPIKWNVYPPENIVLNNPYTNNVVDMNSDVAAGTLEIIVNNLGVDKTEINLYSEEFDIDASTFWYPPSSISNNVSLALSAKINDFKNDSKSQLSAFFIKNNLSYPVPLDGFITWSETYNSINGINQFYSYSGNPIVENTIYNSSRNYSNINIELSTKNVAENPLSIPFTINTHFFNNLYDLQNSKTIYAREYPSSSNIYASLSASDGRIITTNATDGIYFTSAVSITASALTSDFIDMDFNQIYWNLPNGIYNGYSVIFDLSGSHCLTVSALSAQPEYGGFGYYSFEDTVCMQVFPSISGLNFIAFPEYQLFPTHKLAISDNSYLNSVGLTGLSSCITQNFIISTYGGFDEYHYKIGASAKTSSSNIESLSVKYSDVTGSNVISISAFNSIFTKNDPLTIYNTVSSPSTNIFNGTINFVTFPTVSATLSADTNIFNTQIVDTTFFNNIINFYPTGVNIHSASIQYILSSADTIKYSDRITTNNIESYSSFDQFSKNPFSYYSIPRNTFNVFNYFVSGTIIKNVDSFDFCNVSQNFISPIISLTAYDGYYPELEIFSERNVYNTNEYVYFNNATPDTFIPVFSAFVFDDGNSHIQTVHSVNDILTGLYTTEGYYNVSLTGIFQSDPAISKTWESFILIKDSYNTFDSTITRQFPDKLELPISNDKGRIPANSWQFASTLNNAFNNIKTNFEYLSSMSFAYDTNVPKHYVGYATEKEGVLSWIYTKPYEYFYSKDINKLKDIIIKNNQIITINGNKIEIRLNDYNLTPIYSSSYITEGEQFINPIGMAYNDELNKLIVLDTSKKLVYVFEISDTLSLTHYWGGEGERNSRTKLNNPTDIITDTNNNILIVDSDSMVVKIYNKYLNWVNSIIYNGWNESNKPISITADDEYYYILDNTGAVSVFDYSYNYVKSFETHKGTKIYTNPEHPGLLYIISDYIMVYTKNGLYINYIADVISPKKLSFYKNEIYAISDNLIYKFIDYIDTQSVKNNTLSENYWDWNSIFIKENEPLTDYVINDSFKKIHDNIYLLSKEIDHKFVENIDEYDRFIYQGLSALNIDEFCLSSSSYVPIGINELAIYDTINRSVDNVYNDLYKLQCILEVRQERDVAHDMCWTWDYLTINGPQHISSRRRPFSWYELTTANTLYNSALSGITWSTAKACGDSGNSINICWTWEGLECNCYPSMTWEKLECGNAFSITWEQLENNCCTTTNKYFDDCVDPCK